MWKTYCKYTVGNCKVFIMLKETIPRLLYRAKGFKSFTRDSCLEGDGRMEGRKEGRKEGRTDRFGN